MYETVKVGEAGLSILRPLAIPMDGAKPLPEVPVDKWSLLYISAS